MFKITFLLLTKLFVKKTIPKTLRISNLIEKFSPYAQTKKGSLVNGTHVPPFKQEVIVHVGFCCGPPA